MVNVANRRPTFDYDTLKPHLEPLLPGLDLQVLRRGHYHSELGLLINQQRPLEDLNL